MTTSLWKKVTAMAGIGFVLGAADGHALEQSEPLNPQDREVAWRWIHPGPGCPQLPQALIDAGWEQRSLFQDTPGLGCPGLESFCLYQKAHGNVSAGERSELRALPQLEPDIMGLSTSLGSRNLKGSTILSQQEIERLARRFHQQLGKLDFLPEYVGAPNVRLTIVDTSPNTLLNAGPPESSPHGETLTLFAKELLCNGPGDCKVEIQTRLALAYRGFGPTNRDTFRDDLEGGYMGLIGELAEVLIQELQDWHDASPSTNDRLILNLSIAWDQLYGGAQTLPQEMPAPVRAVHVALECLADNGSIVVAAAGNLSDTHPANPATGPSLPAAWTAWPASPALIYAAGGVDVARNPLANSRPDGIPEYAVYSDHAVYNDHAVAAGSGDHMLTGTSVAALGLSAMAAAVAYYAPGLTNEQIFDTIHSSGEDLSLELNATLCEAAPNTPCPEVRYVSLCESLREACSTLSTAVCSQIPTVCTPRSSDRPELSDPNPAPSFDAFLMPSVTFVPLCPVNQLLSTAPPGTPCPSRQYHGLARRPGTTPQPQSDKCPTCTFENGPNGANFYGEVTGLGANEHIENVTLTLSSCTNSPTMAIQLSQQTFSNNYVNIGISNLPVCDSAKLSYTVRSGPQLVGSMVSPILVTGD